MSSAIILTMWCGLMTASLLYYENKIILDFDGTLTDTAKEAKPFLAEFAARFAKRYGVVTDMLEEQVAIKKAEIINDSRRGWEVNGHIIAPALADPYILNYTSYKELMADPDCFLSADVPDMLQNQDELLTALFHECYPFADTVFKPGAKEFLADVCRNHGVAIVTNSKTGAVREKLEKLGKYPVQIIGNAKKYVIDNSFVQVPKSLKLQGFHRPILLRRKQYKDTLDTLTMEGFTPECTTVIGDIFELDLALPAYLGYRSILLGSKEEAASQGILGFEKTIIARNLNELSQLLMGDQ